MMFFMVVILLPDKLMDVIVLQFIQIPLIVVKISFVMSILHKESLPLYLFTASWIATLMSDMLKFVWERDDGFSRYGGFFSTDGFGTQNHSLFF